MNTPEIGMGDRIDELNEYIDRMIPQIEETVNAMPKTECKSWEILDRCFWRLLGI